LLINLVRILATKCSLLFWSGNALEKIQGVANIENKDESLLESIQCDLHCIFCHQFKMYKTGDTAVRRAGNNVDNEFFDDNKCPFTCNKCPFTCSVFRKIAKLRVERLNEQRTNGQCPGPGGDWEGCPFCGSFDKMQSRFDPKKTFVWIFSMTLTITFLQKRKEQSKMRMKPRSVLCDVLCVMR
jgi:hypothetical protein